MGRRATHVLGLDIGTETIKTVELRLSGGRITMTSAPVVVPTPPNSVSGGRISDSDAVVEALAEAVGRNGFSTRKAMITVGGDTDVAVRIIELPRMTGKELEEGVHWELERHTPFPVDQAVYDFQPIERADTPADAPNMEVLLAVAQEETVDLQIEALTAAKLVPLNVDIEPLALSRALVNADENAADQTIVVVHIGGTATQIIIVRRGLLAFVRSIPTAGQQLTAAIRQHLSIDEAAAERIKRLFADFTGSYAFEGGGGDFAAEEDTSSFDAVAEFDEEHGDESVFEPSSALGDYGDESQELDEEATQLDVDSSQAYQLPPSISAPAGITAQEVTTPLSPEHEAVKAAVFEAIAQPILDLATEVRRSLDYYRRTHRNEDINRVLISGGSALIPGIADFMAGEIGVLTEVANPFMNVDTEGIDEDYLQNIGPLCTIAVGLAMRDMLD